MPGGGLSSAESVHRTPYGWAASAWRLDGGGRLELDVVGPDRPVRPPRDRSAVASQ